MVSSVARGRCPYSLIKNSNSAIMFQFFNYFAQYYGAVTYICSMTDSRLSREPRPGTFISNFGATDFRFFGKSIFGLVIQLSVFHLGTAILREMLFFIYSFLSNFSGV